MRARVALWAAVAAVLVAGWTLSQGSAAAALAPPTIPGSGAHVPYLLPTVTASTQHLDAHDGGVVQAGQVFYEYGTSYDCGFQFNVVGTRFCGIKIYSSTDLRRWQLVGLAFDPLGGDWQRTCTPGGCFRPHVVHNAVTGLYVMWVNVFSGSYRVLTAPTPAGPWTLTDGGAVASRSGDETLFVDSTGIGYLVRTDLAGKVATGKSHELELDQLDASYAHVVGAVSRPRVGFVEAPSLFRRQGIYYLAYSDPACAYCTGTGTSVVQSASLAGPWSTPYRITTTSCGGQPTNVSVLSDGKRTVWLYQSDQWVRLGTDTVTRNQKRAGQAWSPLSFTAAGRVQPVRCP
ncbi:MAG: hypothetical protein JWO57_1623 [Pseudonocardiales bacterium]|nr:hypothetical protein [Pseudonocardiales bacterium]